MLWGLGSTDMKGGLAVMLTLAREVAAPAVDVTYVFYAGEEVAAEHNGLAHLLRDRPELLAGDVAILGEPTGGELEAGCQGTLRMEVTLRGARAHTARPWMGRNAIHRMGELLRLVDGFEERQPVIQGVSVPRGAAGGARHGGRGRQRRARRRHRHPQPPLRAGPHREAAADAVRALLAPVLEDGDEVDVVDSAPAAAPGLDNPILRSLVDDHQLTVTAKLGWTDVARFAAVGRARLQPRARRRDARPHRRRAGGSGVARSGLRRARRRPHDGPARLRRLRPGWRSA